MPRYLVEAEVMVRALGHMVVEAADEEEAKKKAMAKVEGGREIWVNGTWDGDGIQWQEYEDLKIINVEEYMRGKQNAATANAN